MVICTMYVYKPRRKKKIPHKTSGSMLAPISWSRLTVNPGVIDIPSIILHHNNVKISEFTLLWCNVTAVITIRLLYKIGSSDAATSFEE